MAHYLFNSVKRDAAKGPALREQAVGFLGVRMWGIDADEPHRDALAAGDLILVYLGAPEREFIGRAELASAVHDWTPSEAQVYPGDFPGGVLLAQVEEWAPPGPYPSSIYGCFYKGTAFQSESFVHLPDPWAGGGSGGNCGGEFAQFIGQTVAADGLYVRSGTTACPTPLTSVDQIGGLLSWSKFFEVAGSTAWTNSQWLQTTVDSSGCPDTTPPNSAPDAVDDGYSVGAGQTLEVTSATSVLANDTDPDNNAIRVKSATTPAEGTLVFLPGVLFDGTFTYTAPADPTSESVTFEYTIEDRGGLTDTATVTISFET